MTRPRMVDWEEVWHHDHDQCSGGQAPRVGMSYGEIAEVLGINKSSVRHIEAVALAKLRAWRALEEWR